jgi:hypothetical protein
MPCFGVVILEANYVIIFVNEVMFANVQQWINSHIYVMKNLKHIPILLIHEKVKVGTISDNIKIVILDAMDKYGWLTNEAMTFKWVYF